MGDPQIPRFAEPGSYVKYFGSHFLDARDIDRKFRYLQLLERDYPLVYPYTGSSLAVDAVSENVEFNDLDPGRKHVYQVYLGVAPMLRVRVFHPFDTRVLKWDANITDISDALTAVVTHAFSPYESPRYQIWIAPNKQYPALQFQNATAALVMGGSSIRPRVVWVGALFNFAVIDESSEPITLAKLKSNEISSTPITFGGSMREIPR